MHLEERKGRLELVIAKQKVDLESTAFKTLAQERTKWAVGRPLPVSRAHSVLRSECRGQAFDLAVECF